MYITVACFSLIVVFVFEHEEWLPVRDDSVQHLSVSGTVWPLPLLPGHSGHAHPLQTSAEVPLSQVCHLSLLLARSVPFT